MGILMKGLDGVVCRNHPKNSCTLSFSPTRTKHQYVVGDYDEAFGDRARRWKSCGNTGVYKPRNHDYKHRLSAARKSEDYRSADLRYAQASAKCLAIELGFTDAGLMGQEYQGENANRFEGGTSSVPRTAGDGVVPARNNTSMQPLHHGSWTRALVGIYCNVPINPASRRSTSWITR